MTNQLGPASAKDSGSSLLSGSTTSTRTPQDTARLIADQIVRPWGERMVRWSELERLWDGLDWRLKLWALTAASGRIVRDGREVEKP